VGRQTSPLSGRGLADLTAVRGTLLTTCASRRRSANRCRPRRASRVGASRPLPSITTKVRLLNRLPTLDLAGRESCPIPVIHWGRPGPGGHGGQTLPKL